MGFNKCGNAPVKRSFVLRYSHLLEPIELCVLTRASKHTHKHTSAPVACPSGLRGSTQDRVYNVRVGSNPTATKCFVKASILLSNFVSTEILLCVVEIP